uniref:Uncharacterized protein n=1 Tax=Arundo donax TaxID=35708 RepID=A0A0A9H1E4_ARUDO
MIQTGTGKVAMVESSSGWNGTEPNQKATGLNKPTALSRTSLCARETVPQKQNIKCHWMLLLPCLLGCHCRGTRNGEPRSRWLASMAGFCAASCSRPPKSFLLPRFTVAGAGTTHNAGRGSGGDKLRDYPSLLLFLSLPP